MNDRWIANKLGLINFWYYDEEEFPLSDGKLLFRGANGSGKSVTMQSFIPLLLDGNKKPERLDPFGSKARKMENYLLVYEDENERTAYLYMEFKKRDSDTFITIGMGMKAVRGKDIDSWYFIINDGRRVGEDFFLYINKAYEKVPLTKKELQNRLGDGGYYTETQGDYKKKVNEYLFGYTDIENYDELIDLLINIRTPKLSKDFKPTAMYEILENSLRQLTEEDLRPMSEAMENMDTIKLRIEQLESCSKAAKQIDYCYSKYNNFILNEKAKKYLEKYSRVKELEKEKKGLEVEAEKAREEIGILMESNGKLEVELETSKKKVDEYLSSDIKETKSKLENVKKEIDGLYEEKSRKSGELKDKQDKLKAQESRIRDITSEIEELEYKRLKVLADMEAFAEECSFRNHDIFKEELNIPVIKEAFARYKNRLRHGREVLYKYDKKRSEYEEVLQQRDKKKNDVEAARVKNLETDDYLTTVKGEQIERIVKWNEKNKELKLDLEKLQQLSRNIMQIIEFPQLAGISQEAVEAYNQKKGDFIVEQKDIGNEIKHYNEEIVSIKARIKELQEQKEVEFTRNEAVIRNRERLKEQGIPFVSLYKAVDYVNTVPEETKVAIEASLVDMGIIDALIIPKENRKEVLAFDRECADKYIFAEPNFLTHNSSSFLKVDGSELNGIKPQEVDDVLTSILLDLNANCHISENGSYGLGILKGKTTSAYELKYIGATSRKLHRERRIEELNKEIEEIGKLISSRQEALNDLKTRLDVVEMEFKNMPSGEDLNKALELLEDTRITLKNEEDALRIAESNFLVVEESVKILKREVYEATEGIELERSREAYEEAEGAARDYEDALNEFDKLQHRLEGKAETLKAVSESIEELTGDIDNILYEINKKNVVLKEREGEKISYEEVLTSLGYRNVEEEIDKCYKIIKSYPEIIKKNSSDIIRLDEKIKSRLDKLVEKQEHIQKENKLLGIFEELVTEEYAVFHSGEHEAGKNTHEICNRIVAFNQEVGTKSKESYDQELFESYNKNSGTLRDYQPRVITVFKKEDVEEEFREIYQNGERKDIKFRVNGKEMSFNALKEIILKETEENKVLLSDREKEFFEDILLKTISNKIMAKIYHSHKWVDKMNALMESMNTSSSFKLTLKWVAKKAENEAELDTKLLTEILEKDAMLIRDEDINKLSRHFSSKIKEVLRALEDNGERKNYHTVIKDILDYRKWYEFKLFSKKEGENYKELTNNAFFQLSGGEKAMAMYVPLFTAIYSMYDMADKKDCPRIAALDEAFAGVDEGNIRDMFRILKEMQLDYILNSQILWGDYDTVENLSIAEIVRPENSDTVSVLRYHWNGKEKQYVV